MQISIALSKHNSGWSSASLLNLNRDLEPLIRSSPEFEETVIKCEVGISPFVITDTTFVKIQVTDIPDDFRSSLIGFNDPVTVVKDTIQPILAVLFEDFTFVT